MVRYYWGIQAVYSILFGNKGCICQILLANTDCIWTEESGVYLVQKIDVELLWMSRAILLDDNAHAHMRIFSR